MPRPGGLGPPAAPKPPLPLNTVLQLSERGDRCFPRKCLPCSARWLRTRRTGLPAPRGYAPRLHTHLFHKPCAARGPTVMCIVLARGSILNFTITEKLEINN